MPEVQADLIINIGETQSNLKNTIKLMNDVDTAAKKSSSESTSSFNSVSESIVDTNANLNKSIGIITNLKAKLADLKKQRDFATTQQDVVKLNDEIKKTEGQLKGVETAFTKTTDKANTNLKQSVGLVQQLKTRIADLKQQREFATTTVEVGQLTDEIRSTETQVKQLEGTLDAFGKRQARGLDELTGSFFAVGQGVIGVTNLIGLLGDKGESENQALIAATRLLVIAESARSVVVGFLKAQELAALLVSKLQTSNAVQQAVATKVVTTAIDEQAVSYAVLAGVKREDIVTTDAQALAYLELAGATEVQSVATKEAAVATTKFNLALLANPYVLIAAGILAIVAALVLFGDKSEKVTQQILDDAQRQLDLENSLASSRQKSLQAQLDFLTKTGQIRESQAAAQAEEQKFADDQLRIKKELDLKLLQEQKDFQDKSSGLRLLGVLQLFSGEQLTDEAASSPVIGPSEDEQKRHNAIIEGINQDFNAQLESSQSEHQSRMNGINLDAGKEQIAEDAKLANLRIALIRNELTRTVAERQQKAKEEIAAILPEETNKAEKIRLINAKAAQDILEIREKASRDAVDILIRQAEAEQAIQLRILSGQAEFGTNQEKLIADQNKARIDLQNELARTLLAREREIQDEAKKQGQGISDPSVLKQINDAKIKVNAEFQKLSDLQEAGFAIARTQLDRNNAKARLDILEDSLEKRLQAFDIDAAAEKERLIKAGADAAAIDKANYKKRLDLTRDFVNDRIDLQTETDKNQMEATIDTAILTDEAIKKIRVAQLEAELEAAERKLDIIKLVAEATGDQTAETLNKISALEAGIQGLKNKINGAKKDIPPINWADIFGIGADFKDEFNAAVGELFSTTTQIWNAAIQEEIAANDALIQSNQSVIDSLNQRISETETALAEEEELFRKGFASNVDAKRQELAALKREREKELADQKKLQADRLKLAQEQQRIDAIGTASSIIASGANLIKTWSTLPFGVGLALAFAQIATIISFIGSLQSKAAQIATSGPGFKEGGWTGEGPNTQEAGVVHRREFVFNEEKTNEYRNIFEKMHRDQPLNSKDITKLLIGTGVVMPEDEKQSILGNNMQIQDQEEKNKADDTFLMKEKLNEISERTASVEKAIKDRPLTYQLPDGSTVIESPNQKKTIRKSV